MFHVGSSFKESKHESCRWSENTADGQHLKLKIYLFPLTEILLHFRSDCKCECDSSCKASAQLSSAPLRTVRLSRSRSANDARLTTQPVCCMQIYWHHVRRWRASPIHIWQTKLSPAWQLMTPVLHASSFSFTFTFSSAFSSLSTPVTCSVRLSQPDLGDAAWVTLRSPPLLQLLQRTVLIQHLRRRHCGQEDGEKEKE